MPWKVYHIDTGETLRGGFEDEDAAKDWLEARSSINEEDYMVEEMDDDEEEYVDPEDAPYQLEEDDVEEESSEEATYEEGDVEVVLTSSLSEAGDDMEMDD